MLKKFFQNITEVFNLSKFGHDSIEVIETSHQNNFHVKIALVYKLKCKT